MLRTAVVGVGHLGVHHARIHAQHPRAQLVGVVDVNAAQAEAVARAHGAEAFTDYAALLGRVDAVSIVTPSRYHFAAARAFLESGAAVLVEKPLANTLADAERLVAIAAEHEALLHVGHIERFNPAFLALQKRAPRPRFVRGERIGPFPFRSTDIGVVLDLMIHDLDILHQLVTAPVARVEATGLSLVTTHEDMASARLTFADGCVADLTASRIAMTPARTMRVFTADRYALLDFKARTLRFWGRSPELAAAAERARTEGDAALAPLRGREWQDLIEVEDVAVDPRDQLEAEIDAFFRCAQGEPVPAVTGDDALRALRTADRILQEIARGNAAFEGRQGR